MFILMKPPSRKRIDPANVYVRKSTLPGAGKGLFTRVAIFKGERIIEYKGVITTYQKIQDNPALNPYVYFVNNNHVIDAMPFPDHPARYANDAEGITTMPGYVNNAGFIVENKRVFIEALADIPPGAEIFVAYGKAYRENIMLRMPAKKNTH